MAALSIEGVGKSFTGRTVLAEISLTVAPGTLVAILGRSGSGKTTLLRLICGFERADAGTIAIDGQVVSDGRLAVPAERRRVGYVAQEGALFPHLRVADNIAFGLPRRARRTRDGVAAMLALVGLPASYAARWPHELSGGEQQRVALARALAPRPRLVLLDEPFSSLDAALRAETRDAVARALLASGATAILVTHDQAEALSLGAAVAVLRDGRLAQMAAPETLYRRPVDVALARFVGEAVVLPGHVARGVAHCRLGALGLAAAVPDGPVEIVVRPEQIRLRPADQSAKRATVSRVTFFGPDARVDLLMDDGTALAARVAGHLAPPVGLDTGIAVEGDVVAFGAAAPPVGFAAAGSPA